MDEIASNPPEPTETAERDAAAPVPDYLQDENGEVLLADDGTPFLQLA